MAISWQEWIRSHPPPPSTAAHCRASGGPAVRRHAATSRTPTGASSRRSSRASSRRPTAAWCGTTTSTRSSTGDAPTTVHPSLWRQSSLVAKQGLYEVVEGIYQVRGLDLSNITLRRGRHRRDRHRPADLHRDGGGRARRCTASIAATGRSIAVIYTHSHVDHFGGVYGVTTQDDVDAGEVAGHRARGLHRARGRRRTSTRAPPWPGAPATCTARRCARGPQGQVGAGSGRPRRPARSALIAPTLDITHTGAEHTVDGVEIEFQMAPGTEAPAEMHFYFPTVPRAVHGRERHPQPAQPADPARRAGPRPARLVALPDRGHRHLRRPTPTSCSPRTTGRPGARDGIVEFLSAPARPLRLPARPDPAAAEPGLHRHRDRRD